MLRCRWPARQQVSLLVIWLLRYGQSCGTPRLNDVRRTAYDLKKLRGKGLISRVGKSRRYTVPPQALRAIAALVLLREKVIRPILAGAALPKRGRKPANWSPIDSHYEAIRKDMVTLFEDLGIAA